MVSNSCWFLFAENRVTRWCNLTCAYLVTDGLWKNQSPTKVLMDHRISYSYSTSQLAGPQKESSLLAIHFQSFFRRSSFQGLNNRIKATNHWTRWWQLNFFLFSSLLEDSHFDEYVSKGVETTNKSLKLQKITEERLGAQHIVDTSALAKKTRWSCFFCFLNGGMCGGFCRRVWLGWKKI